jgi:hypothetical protein
MSIEYKASGSTVVPCKLSVTILSAFQKEKKSNARVTSRWKNPHPEAEFHELTILLRFLDVILRVLRLEFSVYNVYITNQFQTTFAEVTVKQGRLLSQLRPRIRPLRYKFRHYHSGAEGPYCIHQAIAMKRLVRFINKEQDCMHAKIPCLVALFKTFYTLLSLFVYVIFLQ